MTIKDDYYQMKVGDWNVYIDRSDDCVQLWWKAKDLDGDVFPVEMQMTRSGAVHLAEVLLKAVRQLENK